MTWNMERIFNTAGPNRPEVEYTIDPLKRLDLDEFLTLIVQSKYFELHAPRQTGTSKPVIPLLCGGCNPDSTVVVAKKIVIFR